MAATPRADAVKDGRRSALPAATVPDRPLLDGAERGVILLQVGTD
jgi:hypothetical protein